MPKVGTGSIALVDLNDIKASLTAPGSPYEGMLWFNSSDNQLYIYKSGAWVVSTIGLKIGGRNLLAKTKTLDGLAAKTNDLYGDFNIARATKAAGSYSDIYNAKTITTPNSSPVHTVSFFAKASANTRIACHWYSPNSTLTSFNSTGYSSTSVDGLSYVDITTTWQRYWVTWTQDISTTTGPKSIIVGRNNTSADGTIIEIAGVMLQEGNVATAWSPAPEDAEQKIADLTTLMNNISDDNLLDLKDRQKIKDQLFQITGSIIADTTTTMPATTTLDSGLKGSFYKTRKAAINAGVLNTHATYIALATQYNNLKTYLESLGNVEAWDTGSANRNFAVSVVKSTFRDKWLQYYLAEQALEVLTADQLKKNVDNVQVGGRNWIRNSTFNYVLEDTNTLTDWGPIDPLFVALDAEPDQPNCRILNITRTGLTADAIVNAYSNTFPARIGDVFTISLDFKCADPTVWTTQTAFIFEGFNQAGTRTIQQGVSVVNAGVSSLVANTWYRLKYTYTITTADVVNARLRLLQYRNGNISFREIQVEKGNQMTDWTPAPEDNENQLFILEEKYNNAMQNLTDDGITTTVMNNTMYKDAVAELATQDQLGGYTKTSELDDAKAELIDKMDEKITQIDFTPYALSSDVSQTATDLTVKFSAGGGINLINNSVGYNDIVGWTVSGTVGTVKDSSLNQYGYDSGFASTVGVAGSIYQMPYTIVGQSYTISFMVKKETETSTTASACQVVILDSSDTAIAYLGKLSGSGTNTEYERVTYTFVATSSKTKIKVDFEANAKGIISGLMLNVGTVPLQWSMAPGELYNTNIKMDKNGITVNNFTDGVEVGRTVMTPEKFAGYYDIDGSGTIDDSNGSADEAFRVDKDEFIMKKAVVRNEITMGTLKIVNVENASGFTGWAFTGNKTIQS